MNIVVIGDRDTVTAFRLAGVKDTYGLDSGREELKNILADEDIGVVVVTERFAQENHQAIENHRSSKRITPIVIEVPDCTGPMKRETDPISDMIRRAVGAEVSEPFSEGGTS